MIFYLTFIYSIFFVVENFNVTISKIDDSFVHGNREKYSHGWHVLDFFDRVIERYDKDCPVIRMNLREINIDDNDNDKRIVYKY